MSKAIDEQKIEAFFLDLKEKNLRRGYFINPDEEISKDLARSLLTNEARYNYQACPCRLASGKRKEDLDIICPCDYRDADVWEFGSCFCGLYVNKNIFNGLSKAHPIPERRPAKNKRLKMTKEDIPKLNLKFPFWRCSVCGYLCSRENPPEICPICGASHDRFEKVGEKVIK